MKFSLRVGSLAVLFVLASQAGVFAMSQPTLPQCEGSNLTECSSILLVVHDPTPEFSAIVNYSYYSPNQENAVVQVSLDNDFQSQIIWDSGNKGIVFASNGTRCQDISYGTLGNDGYIDGDLQENTIYYWRIGFWGNTGYQDKYFSGWRYGRFKTGPELGHHYVYFKPSNVQDSPIGTFPYSSKDNWCKGIEGITNILTAIIGDNNSNSGGSGTSSFDLASHEVKITVILDCGTGYYMWYYKINEYGQQLKIDGRFVANDEHYITIDNSNDSQPVIQAAYNTDSVIVQAPYTRVKNIKAQGSYYGGCGFKADGANASYITFDNCTAVNNCYGFYIGTCVTDVNIAHDNVQNCKAYDNAFYGIYIAGGSCWPTITNCTIYDDPSTNSSGVGGWYQYTQYYGIYVRSSGGFYGPWCPVNSCEISNNQIYNNIYTGIYLSGDWDAVGQSQIRACKILSNKIYNNGIYGIYEAGYAGYADENSLDIKNNIIWGGDNQDIGIRIGTSYSNVVNNTIYAHDNAGIYQGSTSQCNDPIWNNIICVKDSANSYGIYCNALTPFAYCDFNSIYRMGTAAGKTGYYNSIARSTLSDWRQATGYDNNSIAANPRFVNADALDFHLKSMAGHWDNALQDWIADAETSECIDAGNSSDEYSNEPSPNGYRINLGVYGNTVEASKTWDNSGVSIQEPEFTTIQLSNSDHASDAAYADVNRDGLIDIYLARTNGDNRLYLQYENGDFIDVAASAGVTNPQNARSARFADLDRDGDFDLIVTCDTSNQSKIYINKLMEWGNVSFTSGATGMNFPANATAIAYFDMDNDNDLDVYIGTSGTTAGRLFRNNFDEYTLSFTDVSVNAGDLYNVKGVFDIAILDVDNNGWFDLFISRPDNADMLLFNNGDDSFTDDAAYRGVNHGSGSRGVRAADFNGDGYMDIFLGLSNTDNNILYINNGYGSFTDSAASAGLNFVKANGVAVGDLSADGKYDIYVSSSDGPCRLFSHKATINAEFWNIGQIKGVEGPAYGTGFPKTVLLDRNSTIDLILPSAGADNSVVCFGIPPMQVESRLVSQLENGTLVINANVNRVAINPENVNLEFNGMTFYPTSVFGSIVNFSLLGFDAIPFGAFTLPRLIVGVNGDTIYSGFQSIQMYAKNSNNVPADVFLVDNQGTINFVVNGAADALRFSLDTFEFFTPQRSPLSGTLSIRESDQSKADIFYDNQWFDSIPITDISQGQTRDFLFKTTSYGEIQFQLTLSDINVSETFTIYACVGGTPFVDLSNVSSFKGGENHIFKGHGGEWNGGNKTYLPGTYWWYVKNLDNGSDWLKIKQECIHDNSTLSQGPYTHFGNGANMQVKVCYGKNCSSEINAPTGAADCTSDFKVVTLGLSNSSITISPGNSAVITCSTFPAGGQGLITIANSSVVVVKYDRLISRNDQQIRFFAKAMGQTQVQFKYYLDGVECVNTTTISVDNASEYFGGTPVDYVEGPLTFEVFNYNMRVEVDYMMQNQSGIKTQITTIDNNTLWIPDTAHLENSEKGPFRDLANNGGDIVFLLDKSFDPNGSSQEKDKIGNFQFGGVTYNQLDHLNDNEMHAIGYAYFDYSNDPRSALLVGATLYEPDNTKGGYSFTVSRKAFIFCKKDSVGNGTDLNKCFVVHEISHLFGLADCSNSSFIRDGNVIRNIMGPWNDVMAGQVLDENGNWDRDYSDFTDADKATIRNSAYAK
jgi:hypothetical protein